MKIIKHFNMELKTKGIAAYVDVVQNDSNTRGVDISLFYSGEEWPVPPGVTAAVGYRKPDGTKGLYDQLPNGDRATLISGSMVSATLAPQMLTVAGEVHAVVVLNDADLNQIATFPFIVNVSPNPAAGKVLSNDYYKYSTMEAINNALDGVFEELNDLRDAVSGMGTAITTADNAPAIVAAASGVVVTVQDSSNRPLRGLQIYGNTFQNGAPSPAAPAELVSPGRGGNIKISVTGNNLIDCAEATAVYRHYVNLPVALQPGTYTISGIVESTDTDAQVCNVGFDGGSESGGVAYVSLRRDQRSAATVTLHRPVSTVFFNASDVSDHSKDDTLTLREIQLEPGAEATDYEPYQGQFLTVLTPGGLCGIGEAEDEIDLARGVYVQRITKTVFSGDEVWESFPDYPHLFYTMTGIQAARNNPVLCTHFPYDPGGLMEGKDGCRFTSNGNSQFYISSSIHTSVEDFKAWLKNNPVTMLCILAEPVETPLSDDAVTAFAALHSYYPNTTVYNDANAYMSMRYVADTRIYVDNRPGGGGSVDLTGYATEAWVREGYQPKGEYLTKVPDGYAKTDDIPKKPSDIGAQPAGNYALKNEIPSVPVKSVNGKTGDVSLNAADVKARPENWMPTAQDVGALPATYTPPNQTADQVGADPKGTAANAVSQHNTAENSHNDIRLELKAINDRLTAFFDSDNQTLDELSEIVAYITSNKSLIDAVTTSKVNVVDIINNLTTNVSNKPLSAAQGVVLKGLIDTLSASLANYQPKGNYATVDQLPKKTSQLQNDSGFLTQHQDISGLLPRSELSTAVNTALEQAAASGEFDGAPGRGIKSFVRTAGNGAPGTTDTYTITFTDNTTATLTVYNGTNGANGANGTSVTVQSVNESTAAGGTSVVTFSDGKKLNVKNGNDGPPGYNPQRGIDYWTKADQEAIVQQVISALGTPVFGTVDANNVITLTGTLADGTYTFQYEDEEGATHQLGTYTKEPEPTYTNVIPLSINADGSQYVGANGEDGYKTGYRLNSSGTETEMDGMKVTGYMPVESGATVYLKDVGFGISGSQSTKAYLWAYDSTFTKIHGIMAANLGDSGDCVRNENGELVQFKVLASFFSGVSMAKAAYIRLNSESISGESIITVNEPIV